MLLPSAPGVHAVNGHTGRRVLLSANAELEHRSGNTPSVREPFLLRAEQEPAA